MNTLLQACLRPCHRIVRTAMASLLVGTLAVAHVSAVAGMSSPDTLHTANSNDIEPPEATSVMYAIYEVDGQGEISYPVPSGNVATYWFGHAFKLDGKRYYTGFAWETNERAGEPGPDTQVMITEATFVLSDPAAQQPWSFRGATYYVGEFGAHGEPAYADDRRSPLEYRTPGGKLLLAVPTVSFGQGTSVDGYELFLFDPHADQQNDSQARAWGHVGTLLTGEDNSAACDNGNVMPCVTNQGHLQFIPTNQDDMPRLKVEPSGNTIAATGKTRQLEPKDAAVYRYDPLKRLYVKQ